MSKTKVINEKIKRKYFEWLRGAEGFSDKSIIAVEKAIWKYEEFVDNADYRRFNAKTADQFKKYLATHKNERSNIILSLLSQYHVLRHVNAFFTWLSGQVGYKSRISLHDVTYLRLSKCDSRKATSPSMSAYPTLEYIKKLCSFPIHNDIDQRDRALIAFTALSGMRDQAVVTLPLGCFKPDSLQVHQDPNLGVQTKFSKTIFTTLFKFDKELLQYVLGWYEFLVKEKLFTDADPFFPSTKIELISGNYHAFHADGVIAKFWANASPMRKIFQFRTKQTGLEYFSPHKFRHFAINQAQKYVKSAEQLKAVSQNVGHENIGTTWGYGMIDDFRVGDVINGINFEKTAEQGISEEKLRKIQAILGE